MLGLGLDIPQTASRGGATFSPNSLGDLSYYFDANNTDGWTTAGGRVETVINRGIQRTIGFSQDEEDNRPSLVTSGGSNNKAYLSFDSSNNACLFTSDDGSTPKDAPLGKYYSVFAVSYLNTTSDGNYGISSMRKSGLNRWLFRQVLNSATVDQTQLANWDDTGLVTDGTADTNMGETWVINFGKVYDDGGTTKVEAFVNNATNGAQTISNDLVDTDCLLNIGKANTGGQYMNGFISEFGLYNKALSSPQQQRLMQYLSFKYGITI